MAEGNLIIIDEDTPTSANEEEPLIRSICKKEDFEDSLNKSQGGLPEFTFHNEDAGIVVKFFEKELLRMGTDFGGLTSREPSVGQPVKVTIKCSKEKHRKALQTCFEEIQKGILQYHKEPVKYESKKSVAEEFVKNHVNTSKSLLYLDANNGQVCVAGPTYNDVRSEVHQLKINLGLIKPTTRGDRFNARAPAFERSSSTAGSSQLYPNLSSDSDTSFAEPSDFYIKQTLHGGLELKVYKASILKLNVDVIVNAANDTLVHAGGVARIIAEAAGNELEKESKDYVWKHQKVKVTKNCVTTAGKLRHYKGVIHAVGPQWYMYREDKVRCMDDLYDTVTNILDQCAKRGYRSVAMPAISAGIFGVPKTLCADMYVKAVVDFSKTDQPCPQEFHIVDIDTKILEMVKDSFMRWQVDENSIDQRRTVPEYLKKHQSAQSGWHGGGHGWGHRNQRVFKSDSAHDDASTGSDRGRKDEGNFSSSGRGQSQKPVNDSSRMFSSSGRGQSHRPLNDSSNSRNNGDGGRRWEDGNRGVKTGIACKIETQANRRIGQSITADCFILNDKTTVLIYNGAIDKVSGVDAVVCAADEDLKPGGMTAKALERAGGTRYSDDIREIQKGNNYRKLQKGEVAVSRGGDLRVWCVIHVVLPRVSAEADLPLFKTAMNNILTRAEERGLARIALPMIGIGGIQNKMWLLDKFCDAFVETVCAFCGRNSYPSVKDIHLVNNAQVVCTALNSAFTRGTGRPVTTSVQGRPLPPTPTAERMDIDDDEDDDTYATIEPKITEFSGKDRIVGAGSFSQSRGGGQKSDTLYDSSKYRDIKNNSDDDDDGGGGQRVSRRPDTAGVQSPADSSRDKATGNLMIIDN